MRNSPKHCEAGPRGLVFAYCTGDCFRRALVKEIGRKTGEQHIKYDAQRVNITGGGDR